MLNRANLGLSLVPARKKTEPVKRVGSSVNSGTSPKNAMQAPNASAARVDGIAPTSQRDQKRA